jgi:uncharacterized membrane protein
MGGRGGGLSGNSVLGLSLILAFASAGCAAMVLARWALTLRLSHGFLIWNLFLAWVPYFIALLLVPAKRIRGRAGRRAATALIGIAWLAFFPNSPYIFSDLIHVIRAGYSYKGVAEWITPDALVWYEIILNVTFAFTGHFIGLISLYIVHGAVKEAWNREVGWGAAALAVILSGLGVYIGRFVRLNSWDIFKNPLKSLALIADSAFRPRALLFSFAFAFFIGSTYAMLYVFKSADLASRPDGGGA